MNTVFTLILEFFKTGLFAVGGGLATIPFLHEMIGKYHWFTTEMLTTMIAISESTPGPMGVNMATYVGYHIVGIYGGIVTTLSLVAPSIIVICIVARMLTQFKQSKLVQDIFYGLRPTVVALILSSVISIFILAFFHKGATSFVQAINYLNLVLFAVVYFVYKKFKVHPILVIVGCGILGVVLGL